MSTKSWPIMLKHSAKSIILSLSEYIYNIIYMFIYIYLYIMPDIMSLDVYISPTFFPPKKKQSAKVFTWMI